MLVKFSHYLGKLLTIPPEVSSAAIADLNSVSNMENMCTWCFIYLSPVEKPCHHLSSDTSLVTGRPLRCLPGSTGAERPARVPRAVGDSLRHSAADGHLQKLPPDLRAHHAAVRGDGQADALLPEDGESRVVMGGVVRSLLRGGPGRLLDPGVGSVAYWPRRSGSGLRLVWDGP